jgi:hypothetical protein
MEFSKIIHKKHKKLKHKNRNIIIVVEGLSAGKVWIDHSTTDHEQNKVHKFNWWA